MNGLKLLGRWRWRTSEVVAAGATTRDIETPEVPSGQIRHINRAIVQNVDTANSVLVISVKQAAHETEVYYVKLVTAALWYNIKLELDVFPGELLEYAFSTCTAADDLYVREVGKTYEWAEEGPRSAAKTYAAGVEAMAAGA